MGVNFFCFDHLQEAKRRLGLNPGTYFEAWITAQLKSNEIHTLKDLTALREKLPEGLKNVQSDTNIDDIKAQLAIITSDITTHTKVEFPKMTELYWSNPEDIAPAKLVRAVGAFSF